MAQNSPSGTKHEVVGEMAPNVAEKPTVEYEGFERTITQVVRIRQEEEEDDPADVASLLKGLDQAIKDCRSLRSRLEKLHKRRLRTGRYQRVRKPILSQT